jgi:hypothetical protein
MCEMMDRKYEVVIKDKSYNFVGRFFNGWNINGLEDYVGTCVGNRKNNFSINFINSRFDPYRNVSFYGFPDKIEGMYFGNTKRNYPKYFIVDAKQLILKRFIIDYTNKLFTAWINGYLTVSEALNLWNISFETHDYYEYHRKLIDQNMMMSQTQFLLTTKIFTAKDRLNGRGRLLDNFGIENIYTTSEFKLFWLACSINDSIIQEFLRDNLLGITSMEQTEEWSWTKLFIATYEIEAVYIGSIEKEEGIWHWKKYMDENFKTLTIIHNMKYMIFDEIQVLISKLTPKYFEDPDDPPMEKIELLFFVECSNYQKIYGPITFNLNYMLSRINERNMHSIGKKIQNALEETPNIPLNEYFSYGYPFDIYIIDAQIRYYCHWVKYGDNEKVSRAEINKVIEVGFKLCGGILRDLIIKYSLTWNDWIWNALALAWDLSSPKDLLLRFELTLFEFKLQQYDESKFAN